MIVKKRKNTRAIKEDDCAIRLASDDTLRKKSKQCLNRRIGRYRYWRKRVDGTKWYPFTSNRLFINHLIEYGFIRGVVEFKLYPYKYYWLMAIIWRLQAWNFIVIDAIFIRKVKDIAIIFSAVIASLYYLLELLRNYL